MKRLLLRIIMCSSCLLALAVILSWIRSHRWNDFVEWGWITQGPDGTQWRADTWSGDITTYQGQCAVTCWDRESLAGERTAVQLALPSLFVPPNTIRWEGDPVYPGSARLPFSSTWLGRLGFYFKNDWTSGPEGYVEAVENPPPPPHGTRHLIDLGVPHWFLLLLTLPVPAYRLVVWLRRRRRARRGLCLACGYDLRASDEAGRCPECGRSFNEVLGKPGRQRAARAVAGVVVAGAFAAALVLVTWRPPQPPFDPNAPSDLIVVSETANQVDLEWTDNSANETGFAIERASDAGFTQNLATANLVSDSTIFSDTGLQPNSTYYYRVKTKNHSVFSAASNAVGAMTGATAPRREPPFELVAWPTSASQISLSWIDMSTDEVGFTVERSEDGVGGWTTAGSVGANVTSLNDTGLAEGQTYYYRVKAIGSPSGTGDSEYATSWPIETHRGAPAIAAPATATPSSVTGTTSALSVLGATTSAGGESSLIYIWTATSVPAGASVWFDDNGTNAAKNTTARFSAPGEYTLSVEIVNGTAAVTSNVTVAVER